MQLGRRDTAHSHKVINAITLSANEEESRATVKLIAEETEPDKFFAYGYGAHHFWLTPPQVTQWKAKGIQVIKG